MMASTVSRRSCLILKALHQQSRVTAGFSTHPVLQRDRPYLRDEPASVRLPDSYSGMIQSAQGREHEFSANRDKEMVDYHEANDVESSMKMTSNDVKEDSSYAEAYDNSCNVSLHSVMQSNVPEPYSKGSPTPVNMPGSGSMQRQRYDSHRRVDIKTPPSRSFCTTPFSSNQGGPIPEYNISREDFQPPAAQGVQGDIDQDCLFKLWLENCTRYNLDCDEMLQGVQSGRKTLSQVFAEQDKMIRKVVEQRQSSNISGDAKLEVGVRRFSTSSQYMSPSSSDSDTKSDPQQLTQVEKLKKAIKEYGSTVVVFHVGISLISLGGFYALVSSGIDMVAVLQKVGVGETLLQSSVVSGASTFVVAYAVHKVFAPVRIGITLTSTPFIVRHLRKIGFLKSPPK